MSSDVTPALPTLTPTSVFRNHVHGCSWMLSDPPPVVPPSDPENNHLPANVARLQAESHCLTIRPSILAAAGVSGEPFNPSVAVHGGRLCAVLRVQHPRKTHNFLGVIDSDWHFTDAREMRD